MWWNTSADHVLEMMNEVKSIVKAAVKRLDADFPQNSLYLCFEVFDLDEWRTIDREQNEHRAQQLLDKGKLLFEALRLTWNERFFKEAVGTANGCSGLVTTATPKHVQNRAIWAAALAASQGPDPMPGASAELLWAEPALRFYWSYRDGAGDVERLLG